MLETPVLVEADGSIPGAAGAVAHLDNEDGPEELRQISKSFETAAERHAWIQNHFVLEP